MSKTKEELNALQQQYKELSDKCRELTPEELEQVTGGVVPASDLGPAVILITPEFHRP